MFSVKKDRKPSARSLFHAYIMENTEELTDKEILVKVGTELGWSEQECEKRKGYTKWYRSELRSLGYEAPDPITKK